MWFLPFVECEGDEVILSLVLRLFKKKVENGLWCHMGQRSTCLCLRLELSGSPLYARQIQSLGTAENKLQDMI